eukprot:6001435-Alexandrium_andersonii.AAC.1
MRRWYERRFGARRRDGPGTDVFWADSGAADLRWHVRGDCPGLRGARRPPRPHLGCGLCTRD